MEVKLGQFNMRVGYKDRIFQGDQKRGRRERKGETKGFDGIIKRESERSERNWNESRSRKIQFAAFEMARFPSVFSYPAFSNHNGSWFLLFQLYLLAISSSSLLSSHSQRIQVTTLIPFPLASGVIPYAHTATLIIRYTVP